MTADKNGLAEKHMGLVHSCCKRFKGKGIEYEELFCAGCLGLSKAINGFDQSRGLQFSTYAFPAIMGEIKRLFRDGGAVRVSRPLKELAVKANKLSAELTAKNGREPGLGELARELGTSAEKIADALSCTRLPLSLSGDDESGTLEIPDDDIQYEISERLSLDAAISELEENDRKLINLRYYQDKTQVQTAKILNMTQVQVSRREKKLLALMREKLSG